MSSDFNPTLTLPLEQAMIKDFLRVTPETLVTEAIARLHQLQATCTLHPTPNDSSAVTDCVLVFEGERLVGIFTYRDIVHLIARYETLASLSISEVMTHSPITLSQDQFTDPIVALQILKRHKIRHLPLQGQKGNITGVITYQSLRNLLQPTDFLKARLVEEIMVSAVIQASPQTRLVELVQLIAQHRISCVVLVEEQRNGKGTSGVVPVGIITEGDILQFHALNLDWNLEARGVMSTPLFCLKPNASLLDAHLLMKQRHIHRLPVVGEQGQLLGIVTQTSLLQLINPLDLFQMVEILQEEVTQLKTEKGELLQHQTTRLEYQVQERTLALQHQNLLLKSEIQQRQFTEIQLRTEQQFTETILKNVPDYVLVMNRERTIEFINQTFPGLTQEEVVGQKIDQFTNPEFIEIQNQGIETVFQRGECVSFELVAKWPNQTEADYHVRVAPIRNSDEIEKVLFIATDITEAKQAEIKRNALVMREQLLYKIALHIRQTLNLQEVLDRAVSDIRDLLKSDRVLVYQFDLEFNGVILAESVAPGWTESVGLKLEDTCFRTGGAQHYLAGRSSAIDNIETPNLTTCHRELLQQFQVKANLVVPITIQTQNSESSGFLWGLLIAHQCDSPRKWLSEELELLDEIAIQLAIAIQQSQLYHQAQVELVQRKKAEAKLQKLNQELEERVLERTAALQRQESKSRLFAEIALKIRQSLNLDQILQTTVEEIQKILNCDQVLIYRIFPNKTGRVIAEAVLPGWISLLNLDFPEEVFPPEAQQVYAAGKILAISDIQEAYQKVFPCLVEFLQPWQIQAKLVVSILQHQELWGLTIAHHCSEPRDWTVFEIELLQQIADQVSIAIEQAQLLEKVQEREQFIQKIADGSPNILSIYDVVQDRFIYVSKGVEKVLGYSPEEYQEKGENWINILIHPQDTQKVIEHFKNAANLKDDELLDVKYRVWHKQGYWCWLSSQSTVFNRDLQGQVLQVIGVTQNINEQQTALKELEFQKFALNEAAIVVITDANGIITYVNDNFCKISQYSPEEIIGKTHTVVSSGYHPPSFFADLWSTITAGEVWKGEVQNRAKDGSLYWVDTTIIPFLDEQGNPFQYLAICIDITETKQVELALQNSNQLLAKISRVQDAFIAREEPEIIFYTLLMSLLELTESESGIIREVIDTTNGELTWQERYLKKPEEATLLTPINWNTAAEEFTPLSSKTELEAEELNTLFDVVSLTGKPFISNRYNNPETSQNQSLKSFLGVPFYSHKKLLGIVGVVNRPDGYTQDMINYLQPFLKTCSNLIEAYRTEDQRHQAEENLKQKLAAVEAAIDGIGILRNGKYIYLNRSHIELFGYNSPSDLLGKNWKCLYPKEQVARFEQEIFPLFNQQKYWQGEAIAIRKDGSTFYEEVSLTLTEDGDLICVCRDITERKQAEVQLRQTNEQLAIANTELARASRLKDEFLASMSHELRTPLNSILGMSEVLQEEIYGQLNERQQQSIRTIHRNGQHLLSLINDILDLSKIEAEKLELEFTTVSVKELCQMSLSFIKQQAYQKNIRLQSKIEGVSSPIQVDERRIRQVLINLLSNAVKFTPEEGEITLKVQGNSAENQISFSVIDTGIGIAPEDQHKLFQAFIQIDSRLSRRYEGTGLGLALVKKLVTMHGGTVDVESEVGKGSCFKVILPWQPVNPVSVVSELKLTQPSNATSTPREHPLILIVEENPAHLRSILNYLQAKGYQIELTKNTGEVLQKAETLKPNVILIDIASPEINALEIISQIRTNPEILNVKIVAITTSAMAEDEQQYLLAGANAYLTKPLQIRQLMQVINNEG